MRDFHSRLSEGQTGKLYTIPENCVAITEYETIFGKIHYFKDYFYDSDHIKMYKKRTTKNDTYYHEISRKLNTFQLIDVNNKISTVTIQGLDNIVIRQQKI